MVWKIPAIGQGTFCSDNYSAEQIANAVQMATGMGHRHCDCAAAHQNEVQVGKAIKQACLRNGLQREDVWITGKLSLLLARSRLQTSTAIL